MKLLIIITALLGLSFHSNAADTLSTKITNATVFLNGAQVFRKTNTVQIKKGVNEVIIKDVSPYLNQQKLQAKSMGSFLILDVQYKTEYVAPVAAPPRIVPEKIQREIDRLNDSLLFIGFEKERIQSKLNNLSEEKRMVTQNQLIKSGGISDTLPEFREIVEFYRTKLDEINELIHQWKKTQHFASMRETKHRNRLNELNTYSSNVGQPTRPAKTRHHIVVTTYSDITTSGKIEVNYLVTNAGWIPAYDLRANSTTEPITVTYKARVFQNTGEDWNKVKLTLSTYSQNSHVVKPTLGVWRLDYTMNKPIVHASPAPGQIQMYSQNFESEVQLEEAKEQLQKNQANFQIQNQQFVSMQNMAEINQNFSNVEFEVKLPYTIKADGSQKLMVVTGDRVEARFLHYILPRANKNAFLIAKIGGWENLSLLPGEANIYFNNTTVGTIHLDPAVMSDTMEITLGRDQGIVATRKKVDETLEKSTLTKRQTRTLTFEIEVRNISRASVDLTMEDIIPITDNEEIDIKLIDGDGAEFDKATGKLLWKLKLKPGVKTKLKFSYSVEHDRDKPVS